MPFKLSQYTIFKRLSKYTIIYHTFYQATTIVSNSVAEKLQYGEIGSINPKHLLSLIRSNILVDSGQNEFEIARQQMLKRRKGEDLRLVLIPTYRCNLRCKYCYEGITVAEGESCHSNWPGHIIKFVRSQMDKLIKRRVVLAFFGGEPLLHTDYCMKIVKEVMRTAEELNVRTFVTLTTNGTIFNDEVREFLQYVDSIQITLDGVHENHDKYRYFANRLGTFERIVTFLTEASKCKARKTIRFHLHQYSVEYLRFCAVELKKKIDIDDNLFLYLAQIESGCYQEAFDCTYVKFTDIELRRRLEILRKAKKAFLDSGWDINKVLTGTEETRDKLSSSIRCGQINSGCLLIDPLLDLFFCPVALRNHTLRIGNLHSNKAVFNRLYKQLINQGIFMRDCMACELFPLCEGGCPAKAVVNYGKVDEPFCEKNRIRSLIEYNLQSIADEHGVV